MEKRIYFLTGVTGTVGSEILNVLLRDKHNRVYCLTRSKNGQDYSERFSGLLAENGHSPDTEKAIPLEGDICNEHFGLTRERYEELSRSVTHIIHCAADIRFNNELNELHATNYEGTKNIMEFAKLCKRNNHSFRVMAYVSSAYIAGKRTDTVKENEFTSKYGFNNNYEKTKYEAEVMVRSFIEQGIPIIVFRPSVIFGSSKTGKILISNVMYPLLLLLNKIDLPRIMPHVKNTLLDIVPSDYVAEAICQITKNQENYNKCFHLAAGPKKSMKKNHLMKILIREMTGKNIIFLPQRIWDGIAMLSPEIKNRRNKIAIVNNFIGYDKYSEMNNPLFFIENTEKALINTDIKIPVDIDKYLNLCVGYAKRTFFRKDE